MLECTICANVRRKLRLKRLRTQKWAHYVSSVGIGGLLNGLSPEFFVNWTVDGDEVVCELVKDWSELINSLIKESERLGGLSDFSVLVEDGFDDSLAKNFRKRARSFESRCDGSLESGMLIGTSV